MERWWKSHTASLLLRSAPDFSTPSLSTPVIYLSALYTPAFSILAFLTVTHFPVPHFQSPPNRLCTLCVGAVCKRLKITRTRYMPSLRSDEYEIVFVYHVYNVSQKTAPTLPRYSSKMHKRIVIIFGRKWFLKACASFAESSFF